MIVFISLFLLHTYILLNSGQALAPAEPDVALVLLVSWLVGWLVISWLGVTLCISQQKQANISELDQGINPNPFPNERYSLGGHIRTI